MPRPKARPMSTKHRNAAIAKIHLGKKQLGLDDDTYRAMLNAVAGVNSCKDLTDAGLDNVIAHLKRNGAKFETKKGVGKKPHNLASTAPTAKQLQKLEALLADMSLSWDYAISLATHMYKKQAIEFCDSRELSGLITALTKKQQKQT